MFVTLPILLYHDLGQSVSGMFPDQTVAPKVFESHIGWLAHHGYVGIQATDWIAWRRNGKSLPSKPIIVSFDDGYAGVATYGLPILERYGFGAIVFVVTRRIGSSNTWDEALGYTGSLLMSTEEIVRWSSRGFEFGCHTRTHPDLTSLSKPELQDEVVGSREDLAAIINHVPTTFAYPWGLSNKAVRDYVRGAFNLAFSTRRGINWSRTDPYVMRRSCVRPNRSMLDFACRVTLGLSPLAKVDAFIAKALQSEG